MFHASLNDRSVLSQSLLVIMEEKCILYGHWAFSIANLLMHLKLVYLRGYSTLGRLQRDISTDQGS